MRESTMIGLYKTAKGPGNMELREAPIPKPGPTEVLIEVKAAGICGTDIHIMHDKFPYWPPVIMGHEFSGEIVETGTGVTEFQVGQRVVGEPHTRACGMCELCRTGNIQICASKRSPGWGVDGAFARYIVMPQHLLHLIPDELSAQAAALVEPVANVVQDVLERVTILPNDCVVVIGPGPIGLMALMCARAVSVGKLIIVGTTGDLKSRLPVAEQIGVDAVLLADKEDVVTRVQALTHGRGADVVIEASGAPKAVYATAGMVRKLGVISQIGLTGVEDVPFPWDMAAKKACTLVFNMSTAFTCWDRAIGMLSSGAIDSDLIITDVHPLAEWQEAFRRIESMEAIKALLVP